MGHWSVFGRRVLLATAVFALSACGQSEANSGANEAPAKETAKVVAPPPANKIAWYEGSLDEALVASQESGKPVFLYWGAEWCPPCHLIKATVFKSREFIDRSRRFIPVYLDGDTDNAQALGERFGVLGYPTMILLHPDGHEITRIPGSSDVTAYANALDVSLQANTAVGTLLSTLMDKRAPLTAAECGQLAYHSWGQDQTTLGERNPFAVHRAVYKACPADAALPRSVALMNYLSAANRDEDFLIPASEHGALRAELLALTNNPAAVRANMYSVLFDAAPLTEQLAPAGSPERATLAAAFDAVYEQVAADDSVFMGDRLYTYAGKLAFERLHDPDAAPSPKLGVAIATAVGRADLATEDVYVRQSVMNTANNVLVDAGMLSLSRQLLTKEIGISKQPYYFMVGLADVAQEEGKTEEAIAWLKKAWEVTDGPATRFQWGNYYIAGLIDMTPTQIDTIRNTVLQVFDELAETKAFYQRPRRQLASLKRRLNGWSETPGTAQALATIRRRVSEVCATLPEDDAARTTCESFLEA
ncbi:MAG: thioredoxin family protein [Gammaproteobacteria bacterium]